MPVGQSLPRRARDYADRQQAEATAAGAAAARQWSRVQPGNIDAGWSDAYPNLLQIAATGQERTSARVAPFYNRMTTGQAIEAPLRNPLSGTTGDGRTVQGLLSLAPIQAKQAIAANVAPREALRQVGIWLTSAMVTLIADTARQTEALHQAVRPQVQGYIRMIEPGACSRCAVQAGRWFRSNEGFERHPQCFPEGVVASGPALEGATRRWYEGELVILTTASGQRLPLTGNHPVLTTRGWVPANLLKEGDEVVRSARPDGALPLVVPDHHEVPSRVEDVWRSFGMSGFDTVESSPEDFHGDGQHGEVHVVRADRSLDLGMLAALVEPIAQELLPLASLPALSFDIQGAAALLNFGHAPHTGGFVGGSRLSNPLLAGHIAGAHVGGGAGASALNASFLESHGDNGAGDPVLLGEGVLASSGAVGLSDLLDRQGLQLPRWDAPASPYSMESRVGYAARGQDLLQRLSGQVEVDRLVLCERVDFRGHVYSLQSSEGWHSANNLIVSNCRCYHLPADEADGEDWQTDVSAYFDSLSEAEQNRIFTNAGAEAIRAGADPTKVVNARRGMHTSQVNTGRGWTPQGRMSPVEMFGQDVYITTEGMTRHGHARRTMPNHMSARLMPESIVQLARDQDDLLRLLRTYAYI